MLVDQVELDIGDIEGGPWDLENVVASAVV